VTKHFTIVNPDIKNKKRNYVGSGTIHLEQFKLTKIHTFLDYIRGGCEINLITAIDFTASVREMLFLLFWFWFLFLF
jgi:hypothetical protein